jgi:filamentous hemagglutinin
VGPGSVNGSGGVSPMMSQNESGDQSTTTRSAVSAGTVTLTNAASQTQDIATLSRDTTNTNGTVSSTPNVQNILSQQADTMQATQAAGQTVAQSIGAYADMKKAQADDAAKTALAAGDMEAYKAAVAESKSWAEGGSNRVELHIAGGALVAGLGGGSIGSAAQGAVGAGLSAALAGKLNSVADEVGKDTGSMTLGNVVSNVLATAGGALVGGSAGAFTASNADLYNRSTGNGDGAGGTGSEFLHRLGDALVSTATDPLGALNYALNSILPAPGQKPDADANPMVQANDGGSHTPPTAGAVVTPAPCPIGPGACGIVVTPVISPGAPILSSGDSSSDDKPSSNTSTGSNPQGGNGVDVLLRYKDSWTDAQRAAADAKVQALTGADLTVTPVQRSGTSASSRYKAAGGTIPQGSDVDHTIDLQLGGADTVSNMAPLDSSVNRSLGAQVQQQIKGLPSGTPINSVIIRDH